MACVCTVHALSLFPFSIFVSIFDFRHFSSFQLLCTFFCVCVYTFIFIPVYTHKNAFFVSRLDFLPCVLIDTWISTIIFFFSQHYLFSLFFWRRWKKSFFFCLSSTMILCLPKHIALYSAAFYTSHNKCEKNCNFQLFAANLCTLYAMLFVSSVCLAYPFRFYV